MLNARRGSLSSADKPLGSGTHAGTDGQTCLQRHRGTHTHTHAPRHIQTGGWADKRTEALEVDCVFRAPGLIVKENSPIWVTNRPTNRPIDGPYYTNRPDTCYRQAAGQTARRAGTRSSRPLTFRNPFFLNGFACFLREPRLG